MGELAALVVLFAPGITQIVEAFKRLDPGRALPDWTWIVFGLVIGVILFARVDVDAIPIDAPDQALRAAVGATSAGAAAAVYRIFDLLRARSAATKAKRSS